MSIIISATRDDGKRLRIRGRRLEECDNIIHLVLVLTFRSVVSSSVRTPRSLPSSV